MDKRKILLIDDSLHSIEKLSFLISNFTKLEVVVPSPNELAIDLFESNDYEYVIIEHNSKNSNEFMNRALELKPKEKIILLSDSINCPIDCISCLSMFKFVRLLKPISPENIIKYLTIDTENDKENFSCPNKYRFDDINTLEKLFEFIYLEENIYFTSKELYEDRIMIKTKLSSAIRFNELTKIEDLINKRYFDVKVLDDSSIQINPI